MSKSLQLKEEGNRHFQAGDYIGADGLYSKAIIADAKNPALYTNRAMARLKLGHWESVIADCQTCLALSPQNMKAHYYLAQAQLSICDYDSALENALAAHKLCATTNDKSLGAVTTMVLRCKKDRWGGSREEASAHGTSVFEAARAQNQKKREVPDWAIDDISFDIMVDPVITKTGKSYERATIMEHLRRHPSDPLTREPLSAADLRPNLALRQACEEFLDQNGWAADW
ncbi:hypothetical protein TrVGV298_007939 [Trichoderma virens]|nr:hypothetical protein TrVGV298_007939 [Trichoderma virens]